MLDRIALILVIIGGINWGSIGLFKFDIVGWICGGQDAVISRIIYTLVALAAVCVYHCYSSKMKFYPPITAKKEHKTKSPAQPDFFSVIFVLSAMT